jgi:glutamate N-acetyltransferase/amino-acid N-acetyltransferase
LKSICDIDGVYTQGASAGIYEKKSRLDMACIYVPDCRASAGVFTRNKFRAACVDYTENLTKSGKVFKAVIINAGNANAATGPEGKDNVIKTVQRAADKLGISPQEVAVASTGVIGKQLPMDKILKGLDQLLAEPKTQEPQQAAEAILTLDTKVKLAHEQAGKLIVSGFAKGAGMIAPNMATMLGFIVTNADIPSKSLRVKLQSAVEKSFNMVSVDTDTSTNDMVLILSTGTESIEGKEQEFSQLLEKTCVSLARQIAADGEGASKLIEAHVSGARSESEARIVAKNVIDSPLVKTAMHGSDPNWGRIMMAIGKSPDIRFLPSGVDVTLAKQLVFKQGEPTEFNRQELSEKLKSETVRIEVNLNSGAFEATSWGCDLSKTYIDINTEYN